MKTVTGRIHAIESCGLVDGPGVRYIAFLQGCPLRCLYCHNPDSWKSKGGREMTSQELVEEAWKYRTWMNASGGGITLSGGEPLLQAEFTLDVIEKAHKKGMTVALDTSGFGDWDSIKPCLDKADLILLDIKTTVLSRHKVLTGVPADQPLRTLDYLKSISKPLWIRHVVVPGLTDDRENLDRLKEILLTVPSLEKFEFLPFHKMGEEKWALEGLEYKLKDTPVPEAEFIRSITEEFKEAGIPL